MRAHDKLQNANPKLDAWFYLQTYAKFFKTWILLWYTKRKIQSNKSFKNDTVSQFLNPKENNDGFSKPMLLKLILSFGPLFYKCYLW